MPAIRTTRSNNKRGTNQHQPIPILEQYPDLPQIIQDHINNNGKQKDIVRMLWREHNIRVSLRSVQRLMQKEGVLTTRRNGLSLVDQGVAILRCQEDDPLGRWGGRLIKEKLARKGIHVARDFITKFRTALDPIAAANRHPVTRKIHPHGLHCSGPNEEWCVNGHEKLLRDMGIAIWGIIDKFARKEIELFAVPNARLAVVPPALYLRAVRRRGGIPVTNASDKGSELSMFIPLVMTLRQIYQPFLPEDTLPSHRAVKSVYNITRERGWRPIWEKELGNVLHEYKAGKEIAQFHVNDPIHEGISLWLWAKIVQLRLDDIVAESGSHFVRKQPNSLLPTGGRRIDFYNDPERFKGVDQLIKVNVNEIDELLEEYDKPEYTQFVSDDMGALCDDLYSAIGSPALSAKKGWYIWALMMDHYNSTPVDV